MCAYGCVSAIFFPCVCDWEMCSCPHQALTFSKETLLDRLIDGFVREKVEGGATLVKQGTSPDFLFVVER